MRYTLRCVLLFVIAFAGCKSKKNIITVPSAAPVDSAQEKAVKSFETNETFADFATEFLELKYGIKPDEYLFVSPRKQKMYWIKNNQLVKTFTISTAEKGIGNEWGSEKTPYGLHKVKMKIGDGVPLYGRFVGRRFTGKIATIYTDTSRSPTDDVLTRILWLEGLEPGVNKGRKVDSFKRHIYIHGTSEEGRLGRPASHGCIRMKNDEIMELYDHIKEGTIVYIHHK